MSQVTVILRRLTTADLPAISGWFEDPDTSRFLGGSEWPARMLAIADRSIGTTFRGAVQTGAHHYLGLAGGTPVGYIDCGTFDRCTTYDGEGPEGPIITETIDALTGSIAFVIDPTVRRRGIGRAMIAALLDRSELRLIELFEAGVEPENTASQHCLEAVGFQPRSMQPDFEGMLYYRAPGGEIFPIRGRRRRKDSDPAAPIPTPADGDDYTVRASLTRTDRQVSLDGHVSGTRR